jgi:predicted aminopeptidase
MKMVALVSTRNLLKAALVMLVLVSLIACETIGYYEQAVRGQLSILWSRQQIDELLQSGAVSEELRQKLTTVRSAREFAIQQLLLPGGKGYQTYVELDREHVVWNVFAAPEFSIDPVNWCYPVAGCVSYRGYFSEAGAVKFANKLENEGYDVYTGGVDAYSTLGWFDDPLLSTVINRADYQLVALVFHELAHQKVYLPGDTTFNESFATLVEREGLRRWLVSQNSSELMARADQQSQRQQQFIDLVIGYRDRFEGLYDSEMSQMNKRTRKTALQEEMRSSYAQLKRSWGGAPSYDSWFASSLNNAQLSTVSSYNELVPAFQALLNSQQGDMAAFYEQVELLAELEEDEREVRYEQLLQ